MIGRARFLIAALVLMAGVAPTTWAQAYPAKPIRLVVGFPPGGSVDIIARTVGQKLGESLRQQIVIDNRPGAAGGIAAEITAKAAPDGYTLFMQDIPTHAINASYYRNLPYDPVKDFSTVILVASAPIVLVANPSFPAKSVSQLIALARAKSGQINFASGGNGSSTQLAGEMLKIMANINLTHVPYKGAPLAMADVISGQVQLLFSSLPGALPLIRAGKISAIAVTSTKRASSAAEIPAIAESGFPDYEASQCFGLLAPASTPQPVIAKLNADVLQALRSPDVVQAIAKQGYDALGGTPGDFDSYLKSEIAKWAKIVRAAELRPD